MKEFTAVDLSNLPIYTKQSICDNTLDDARLAVRCPLDNGRHVGSSLSPRSSVDRPARLCVPGTNLQLLLTFPMLSLARKTQVYILPPSMAEQKNTNVKLLSCLVSEDDTDDSDYRFLVHRHAIKYVTTALGIFSDAEDDRTFEPVLLGELLPPVPAGEWNQGHLAGQGPPDRRARVCADKDRAAHRRPAAMAPFSGWTCWAFV